MHKFKTIQFLVAVVFSGLILGFLGSCSLDVGDKKNEGGGTPNGQRPSPELGGGNSQDSDYLDWNSVPKDFNPKIETKTLDLTNINRLEVDLFGFTSDVELIYATAEKGLVHSYSVFKNYSPGWNEVKSTSSGQSLKISRGGNYRCSIEIKNRNISTLDGKCLVKVQIVLPQDSTIEVYNVGTLISKRFLPIETETFLNNFKKANFSKEKFAVIDDYLASYNSRGKKPELNSTQLGEVISDFMDRDEKKTALRLLHSAVADRAALSKMIDDVFSYFDREDARSIAGL